jgi:hypothetical protein
MRFDVKSVSKFLCDPRVNAYGTLFTQQVALVPETVRQTCLHRSIGGAAAPGTIVWKVEPPILIKHLRFPVFKSCPTKTFSELRPSPKSHILLFLTMAQLVKEYHAQMLMLFGSLKDGSTNDWELSPRINTLYEDAPNAPDAWDVGETLGTERDPVTPVPSTSS